MHDDEKPAGQVELPYAYWLGQYPVSQAQYAEFTPAGGYKEASYWPEATERGYWRDGRFKGLLDSNWRSGPYDLGHPYNLPNHPVVGISWYEAVAFCRWLTDLWRAKDKLPEGWRIQLPSEIEWEKGARGGLEIPAEPLVMSLEDDAWRPELVLSLAENGQPQRNFPWGEADFTPDRANYQETELRKTSAIGCFPTNVSPVGCVEMSGNVWEWTRSKYMPYPYKPKEAEQLDSSNDGRVIRGGSWGASSQVLPCAYRLRLNPTDGVNDLGFRVCASPFSIP